MSCPALFSVGILRKISRNRRFPRLRCTALPTFRLTTKPMRPSDSTPAGDARVRITNSRVTRLRGAANTRSNSALQVSRSFLPWAGCCDFSITGLLLVCNRCQASAAFGASSFQYVTAVGGGHSLAEAMGSEFFQFAGLVRTFHTIDLDSVDK